MIPQFFWRHVLFFLSNRRPSGYDKPSKQPQRKKKMSFARSSIFRGIGLSPYSCTSRNTLSRYMYISMYICLVVCDHRSCLSRGWGTGMDAGRWVCWMSMGRNNGHTVEITQVVLMTSQDFSCFRCDFFCDFFFTIETAVGPS